MKLIIVPIVAILAIAFLEYTALKEGINGALVGIVIAAIAGLGGYEIKVLKEKVIAKKKKGDE